MTAAKSADVRWLLKDALGVVFKRKRLIFGLFLIVALGISLAVLPFTNLSGDPSQEFFSDGMTEEITSALARIPDLRVVGRKGGRALAATPRRLG